MKAILRYYHEDEVPFPLNQFTVFPVLDLNIHGAPHSRQHRKIIQQYREELYDLATRKLRIKLPIDWHITLKVLFTNPNSPDNDHLLTALYMALDSKTLQGPAILADDRWVQDVFLKKMYSYDATKRDGLR